MPAPRIYGFGGEAWGDPLGLGGPLYVVRARAIEGQTVRVVFDEEPVHLTAAGTTDALNPSNYDIEITAGQGVKPQVIGVKENMVTGPTLAVFAGDERAFDIQTDRQLIVGLQYRVTVRRLISQVGGTLGAPYAQPFAGIIRLQEPHLPTGQRGLVDIASDAVTGGYSVDAGGDIANQSDQDGYRKRVIRRVVTSRGAFAWLPDYGLALPFKRPMAQRQLGELSQEIVRQVMLEPETASVIPELTLYAAGALVVQIAIRTKRGAFFSVTVKSDTATGIVVA